ncbi:5841_t:CDS:2, partial [Entrophospora sp. SA101]
MDEDEELANPFNNLLTDDNNQQVLAHKAVFFLDGLRDQTMGIDDNPIENEPDPAARRRAEFLMEQRDALEAGRPVESTMCKL